MMSAHDLMWCCHDNTHAQQIRLPQFRKCKVKEVALSRITHTRTHIHIPILTTHTHTHTRTHTHTHTHAHTHKHTHTHTCIHTHTHAHTSPISHREGEVCSNPPSQTRGSSPGIPFGHTLRPFLPLPPLDCTGCTLGTPCAHSSLPLPLPLPLPQSGHPAPNGDCSLNNGAPVEAVVQTGGGGGGRERERV